jgi:hypothetical protein
VRSEVVHAANGNVHLYGGAVIERVNSFNARHSLKANPTNVFAELSYQMVTQQPHTLVQVCLTEENEVVGHAVTLIQELYGHRTAMIYQLEIDDLARDKSREEMLRSGLNQIVAWAENGGCQEVRCWAMNKKLAEVFKRFGFADKDFRFCEVGIV